ncbi:hypothetical protein [Ornithinimicrobium avium]|uniref:hypothetical protein n=1 Tax=Ornithinimicrobium avium TaxID=2283195 RepID=UPI0013B45681|nr:hypothetical protein [Ornithinimicrobium avium]
MNRLRFTMSFHSAFLSATGQAADGYDLTLDLENPVRESHLKGVMSDAAARVLRFPPARIEQIFGSPAQESPWRWQVTEQQCARAVVRHRVGIDDDTHCAHQDMLVRARAGHLDTVAFEVYRVTDPEDLMERTAITCSARAVHRLGGQRRRGFGWVGVEGGDDLDTTSLSRLRTWVSTA